MSFKGFSREKLVKNSIQRQLKPFIDKHLQFQIPGNEEPLSCETKNYTPIFSHCLNTGPHNQTLPSQVNEKELTRSMQEATQSYEAWKNMKNTLETFFTTKN